MGELHPFGVWELTITITLTIAPVIPLQTVGWLRRYGNGVSSTKCGSQLPVHIFLENQILKVIKNPSYHGRKQWCLSVLACLSEAPALG